MSSFQQFELVPEGMGPHNIDQIIFLKNYGEFAKEEIKITEMYKSYYKSLMEEKFRSGRTIKPFAETLENIIKLWPHKSKQFEKIRESILDELKNSGNEKI